MEGSGLTGRMFSGLRSGMMGMEMPIQQPATGGAPPAAPPQQNPQLRPQQLLRPLQPQMAGFAHQDQPQPQLPMKQTTYSFMPNASQQNQQQAMSEEEDSSVDGKKKVSLWQRMKWTDSMVKMLIFTVFFVGDEAGSEVNEKKKSGASLQKKGKWKSVSRAMLEKGFNVSPQQCEDKFNDLNKRYKRVTEILGKGTACQVVENQSLLETMDLSPKMKDEARKLLNSKHLFFKEMCIYHNSCAQSGGGRCGGDGASGSHFPPEVSTDMVHAHRHHHQQLPRFSDHHSPVPLSSAVTPEDSSRMKGVSGEEDNGSGNEDDSNEDDSDDEPAYNSEEALRKKARIEIPTSPRSRKIKADVTSVLQDGTKSSWEKKQWINEQMVKLEELGLEYKVKAFELAKGRMKWIKFSTNKEKEMKRLKYENQRKRIENERMMLFLRQKELTVVDQQQNSGSRVG